MTGPTPRSPTPRSAGPRRDASSPDAYADAASRPAGHRPSTPTGSPRSTPPTRTAWPDAACSTSTTCCCEAGDPPAPRPLRRPAARWRYRHVAVDEFQDVNPAQFRLVEALLGTRVDLCAVGDPNQAIYGWNGADPTCWPRCPTASPGLEVVHLDRNHRCTPQVVAVAAAALGPAAGGPSRVGGRRRCRCPRSPPSPTTGPRPRRWPRGSWRGPRPGTAWSDQAVLARTHDLLAGVRRALDAAGIPCRFAPAPESAAAEAPGPASGRAAARLQIVAAGATPAVRSSWPPSTGPRDSSGRPCPSSGSRRASCRSSTPPPRRRSPRSGACSTWPSPGRPAPRVLVGPVPDDGRRAGHGASTVPVAGRPGRRCAAGDARPAPPDAAERFAALRANLRGYAPVRPGPVRDATAAPVSRPTCR